MTARSLALVAIAAWAVGLAGAASPSTGALPPSDAESPGEIPGGLAAAGPLTPAEEAIAEAAAALAGIPAIVAAPAPPILRPLRSERTESPAMEHHAGPERYGLALPYGDAQFERFRAAYLSPGGRKWLEAVYERSRPFASYVQERIRYYGLPEELFFLPFIESEYSPKAVSRSGAAGMWQFMKNSVAGYDMRMDDWIDERRDFMKSTDAALQKLRYNYDRFGDWLLALAAYNCGAGAMDRIVKSSGGDTDYWSLRARGLLPKETASYIPKLLAVVSVAMHGGRNGLSSSWTPSIDWVKVPLDRPVDIAMLASISGVPFETLKAGNPELRYAVTPPEGRYSVKVPVPFEESVRKAIASKDVLMNVYIHFVKSGDTISAIASHYEVPVAMIAKLNPGLNPDKIRIGQKIVIPAFKDKKPYVADTSDDELSFTGRYVIVKGDTLWSISLRYGVQPETLATKNGLEISSLLREGQALAVPIMQ